MGNLRAKSAKAAVNPPYVTRGFNSQTTNLPSASELSEQEQKVLAGAPFVVGVHWLRGSVLDTKVDWLVEKMCVLFGTEYEEHPYGLLPRYDRHYRWPCGASIQFHSTEAGSELTAGRIAVEIPGKALESVDTWYIGSFCVALQNHGFQASRIDLYFDDHRRLITPRRLHKTIVEEDVFSDEQVLPDVSHFRIIEHKFRAKSGVGVIFDEVAFGRRGSKGSGKYMRFYDKSLESGGENNACRWELELSGQKARSAFDEIVRAFKKSGGGNSKSIDAMTDVIGGIIGGSIDFLKRTERAGDKNLCRLTRYHFWSLILEGIGKAKLATRIVVKTIEGAREWVGKQVTGILQMLTTALGRAEFLASLVERCVETDRIKPHHQQLIDAYRDQVDRKRDHVERDWDQMNREWDQAGPK